MTINEKYTDKAEWQRGFDYAHAEAVKAFDAIQNKTKQGYYIGGRLFNKRMAAENITRDHKSDDWLAGADTAIHLEFVRRWEGAPDEQPAIFSVMGMGGLVGVHVPAEIPINTVSEPIKKEPVKKPGRFDDIIDII